MCSKNNRYIKLFKKNTKERSDCNALLAIRMVLHFSVRKHVFFSQGGDHMIISFGFTAQKVNTPFGDFTFSPFGDFSIPKEVNDYPAALLQII